MVMCNCEEPIECVTCLQRALATAQAERDAARQEAAAAQAAHDATAQRYNMAIDRLHAEKDAMSRDGSSLRASLARLQQEREGRLRRVCVAAKSRSPVSTVADAAWHPPRHRSEVMIKIAPSPTAERRRS